MEKKIINIKKSLDKINCEIKKINIQIDELEKEEEKKGIYYIEDLPKNAQEVFNNLLLMVGPIDYCRKCGNVFKEGYLCNCGHDNSIKTSVKNWAKPKFII